LWTPRGWGRPSRSGPRSRLRPLPAARLEVAPGTGLGEREGGPRLPVHRVRVAASGVDGPGQGVEGDPVLQVEQHLPDPDCEVAAPGAAGGVDDPPDVGVLLWSNFDQRKRVSSCEQEGR